jgi:RimJ/RimL family protein N-acetyltransferase
MSIVLETDRLILRRLAAQDAPFILETVVGLNRIVAITAPDNLRSIRVLDRLGFRCERTVRLPTDTAEILLYALTLPAELASLLQPLAPLGE